MSQSVLVAKPHELPRRGITLSDCVGIVIGCAVTLGIWRMHGPLPRTVAQKSAARPFTMRAARAAASLCVFGLAAGPAIMIPRAARWGWKSVTVSESGWLIFGLAFCTIVLGIQLTPLLFAEDRWRRGIVLFTVLSGFMCWFCDLVLRTATPRRTAIERCATGWTHRFSLGLWVCSAATAVLLYCVVR